LLQKQQDKDRLLLDLRQQKQQDRQFQQRITEERQNRLLQKQRDKDRLLQSFLGVVLDVEDPESRRSIAQVLKVKFPEYQNVIDTFAGVHEPTPDEKFKRKLVEQAAEQKLTNLNNNIALAKMNGDQKEIDRLKKERQALLANPIETVTRVVRFGTEESLARAIAKMREVGYSTKDVKPTLDKLLEVNPNASEEEILQMAVEGAPKTQPADQVETPGTSTTPSTPEESVRVIAEKTKQALRTALAPKNDTEAVKEQTRTQIKNAKQALRDLQTSPILRKLRGKPNKTKKDKALLLEYKNQIKALRTQLRTLSAQLRKL